MEGKYRNFCGLPECPVFPEYCETYVYYCETLDELERRGVETNNGGEDEYKQNKDK